MSAAGKVSTLDTRIVGLVKREASLQRLARAYIAAGLLFMLLPGTFLGVWNLLSISSRQTVSDISPAWLQAHGHAQIFGWIGTFILGIGFYSLSKMGDVPTFAVVRGWICLALWVAGVTLRWLANIVQWEWRVLLPLSALLELAGFLIFFGTVSRHRPAEVSKSVCSPPKGREAWMLMVVAGTFGFLITLLVNAGITAYLAVLADTPSIPHTLDQRLLILPAWGFLVPTVWGFSARWLPVFLGLRARNSRWLFGALGAAWGAILLSVAGMPFYSASLLFLAAIAAILAVGVFEPSVRPANIAHVHTSFPVFVRGAYVWLLIASALTVWAAVSDHYGGMWGASRHALTVGFLSTMVFAIGQKVLPAFSGGRVLLSTNLMFASLLLLTAGCGLRVVSEIPAYEWNLNWAWALLPISAVTELTAVTLFAVNLFATLASRPPE